MSETGLGEGGEPRACSMSCWSKGWLLPDPRKKEMSQKQGPGGRQNTCMLPCGCSPSALARIWWMKCVVLQDRINQVETFNDPPGSLVLGESNGAHSERLEQKGRGKQELESKNWRRLILGKGNERLMKQPK